MQGGFARFRLVQRLFEVFVKPGIFQGNGDLRGEVLDHLESLGGEGSLNQVVFQVNDAAQR